MPACGEWVMKDVPEERAPEGKIKEEVSTEFLLLSFEIMGKVQPFKVKCTYSPPYDSVLQVYYSTCSEHWIL